jgi:hypothetical protein
LHRVLRQERHIVRVPDAEYVAHHAHLVFFRRLPYLPAISSLLPKARKAAKSLAV